MRGLGRLAVARWHTVLAGVLLTTIAAALVFTCIPMNFRSSGTLVVMPPPRSVKQATNPLLVNESRMNTAASILTQTISSPFLFFRAGLNPGSDTVTAKNATPSAPASPNGSPFITITAESRDALRGPAIIYWMTDLSRENLAERQRDLKVAKRNSLTLDTVVAPTAGAPVLVPPIGVTTATIVLGLLLTIGAAYRIDRAEMRRREELAPVVPLDGTDDRKLTVIPAAPAASLGQRRKVG